MLDPCLSLSYFHRLSLGERPCSVCIHAFFINTQWSSFEGLRSLVAIRVWFLTLCCAVEGEKITLAPDKGHWR